MSISDEGTRDANLRNLMRQALQEAGIEGSDEHLFSLGGVETCWGEANGDIELRFNSFTFCGRFHVSVGLRYFAALVLDGNCHGEDDGVDKLSAIIKYIQAMIVEISESVRNDLNAGTMNRLVDGLSGEDLERLKPPLLKQGKRVGSKYRKVLRGERRQGGNQRTAPDWLDPDNLKRFAQLVTERVPLVNQIKEVFKCCDEEDGWMSELGEDRTFRLLSEGLPAETLLFAAKRVADDSLPAAEREPQAIACRMTCRELGFHEPQDIGTLHGYYRNGKELIKQTRQSSR